MRRVAVAAVAVALVVAAPGFVASLALADVSSFPIALKDHQFVPSELQVPAGAKVKLVVRNDGNTPSEFESNQLHREKIVVPGQQVEVFVGPLDPGSYEFFDDFHPQTRGHLIVK